LEKEYSSKENYKEILGRESGKEKTQVERVGNRDWGIETLKLGRESEGGIVGKREWEKCLGR